MANIDRIVNASILLRSAPVAEKTFSDMVILADHNFTVRRVSSVSSADELLDKGILPTDALYKAVSAAFQQEPGVDTVYIARRMPGSSGLTVQLPQGETGEVFEVTFEYFDAQKQLKSTTFSYTTVNDSTDDTADKIATLLAATINADVDLTSGASSSSITVASANGVPAITSVSSNLRSTFTPSTEAIPVALAAARKENDVFYGVCATTRVEAEQIALAKWCESVDKLCGLASANSNAKVGGQANLLAKCQKLNLFRTYVAFSEEATPNNEYPEVAWMSRKFREQPGSETWANTTLSAVTSDRLDEAEYKAITSLNGNTFEPFRTLSLTQNGKVAGGEWIDVIRFRDWLLEKIRVDQFSAFVNNRLGFTDEGIATLHNKLLGSLNKGKDVGGIAPEELDPTTDRIIPSYTTTIPSASSFSANEKAQRVLKGIKFTARLTGAIHAVEINGTLAYEL
jgi:hypothetical protein